MKTGEPSRAQTCDPLIKSAFRVTPAGYGSYDFTFVTGCIRQRVYLLLPIIPSLSGVLSRVCLKLSYKACCFVPGPISACGNRTQAGFFTIRCEVLGLDFATESKLQQRFRGQQNIG